MEHGLSLLQTPAGHEDVGLEGEASRVDQAGGSQRHGEGAGAAQALESSGHVAPLREEPAEQAEARCEGQAPGRPALAERGRPLLQRDCLGQVFGDSQGQAGAILEPGGESQALGIASFVQRQGLDECGLGIRNLAVPLSQPAESAPELSLDGRRRGARLAQRVRRGGLSLSEASRPRLRLRNL
jgi:hypothetical protein